MEKLGIGEFAGKKLAIVITAMIVFVGCGSRQAGIDSLTVGSEGSAEGFVGQLLPVSAGIRTTAPIDHVEVDIRPIDGQGWTFSEQFTEGIAGSTGIAFRADVDIPIETEPGDYKLTLRVVTDDHTVVTESTDLRVGIDTTVPVASTLDVGINAAGNDLHLETELAVPGKIKEVRVAVEGQDWRDEFSFAGSKLVGQVTYHFHEHVHVDRAPAGTYRVIVTVADQQGREAHTEAAFTKK